LGIEVFKTLQTVSCSVDEYCDPSHSQKLRFPFLGEIPSGRFQLDEMGRFLFYGREKFRELYAAVKGMRFQGTRMYFLHGTQGSGKSFMLAALACLLMKEGNKVVYVPDCRGLLRDMFGYLRLALCLTFHGPGHEARADLLDKCTTIGELEEFCAAVTPKYRLLFIIDQANALDSEEEAADRFTPQAKRDARTLLDKITAQHLKLASSSGNYQHGLYDRYRQTGEERLQLYGGLTKV